MRAQLINKRANYINHKTSLSSRLIVCRSPCMCVHKCVLECGPVFISSCLRLVTSAKCRVHRLRTAFTYETPGKHSVKRCHAMKWPSTCLHFLNRWIEKRLPIDEPPPKCSLMFLRCCVWLFLRLTLSHTHRMCVSRTLVLMPFCVYIGLVPLVRCTRVPNKIIEFQVYRW